MGHALRSAPLESSNQEAKWDESLDSAKEFLDTEELLTDDNVDAPDAELEISPPMGKTQFTDLRRRIEERLDSKRLAHEIDFDDLDDF